MLALDDHELEAIEDDEKRSELYEKEYRTQDGCSKTSKTKSAEQYLKEQSARTLNRQNLYQKLYKSYNMIGIRQMWRHEHFMKLKISHSKTEVQG